MALYAWTAMDARKLGFQATVIEDACRGIDNQGSLAAAWKSMEKAGVKRVQSSALALAASSLQQLRKRRRICPVSGSAVPPP